MTEPRRSRWSLWAEWDADTDPALRRMADALAPPPVEEPKPAEAKPAPTPDPVPVDVLGRRERIAQLVGKLRAGDTTVIDALKELLP